MRGAYLRQRVGVIVSVGVLLLLNVPSPSVIQAENLSGRSVTVSDTLPSAIASHQFTFTIPSYSDLGSIKFEYCDNTPHPNSYCTVPVGFSVANASLEQQSGETGFDLDVINNHAMVLGRNPTAPTGATNSYTFNNIVNPSQEHKMVYVRITTYESGDASGPYTDDGAVIFSTVRNIAVNGYVPPYLTFCVGVTVEINCANATGSLLDFGELSGARTKALTSQYSGSTNDPGGFTTGVMGVTMTSGNNTIPALTTPSVARPGTGQFGMNLRANSSPGIGSEREGPGTSAAIGPVNVPNQFYFGNQIISGSPQSTDYNRFTVSYIVNVGASQRPGIYSTTLTYVAVAAF